MNNSVKQKEVEKIDIVEKAKKQANNKNANDPKRQSGFLGFLSQNWAIILAIIYIISPIDLIPGAIFPVVGQLDDLLALGFTLYQSYKAYKGV